MYVVGPRGVVATHYQTHKPPGEKFATMPLGDTVSPVFNTPLGRTGLMLGAEGMVPEVARSLMLRGAEVILWSGDSASAPMSMFARTRSDENRVFVVMAAAPTENGGALITDAAGGIQQAALIGREHSISATVNRALAHLKARAPGTDVLLDRQPASYNVITRPLPIPETVV
jgi:predicted amidohydrolase